VAYEYQIGKYEVTNAQYAEFLNAVADTDSNGLYNTSMDTDARGGITRTGSSGSFLYSVKTGYENMPVVFVSHLDAQRFANWIHNGQPTGAQGPGTTETGAYTVGNLAIHSSNAAVWLPTVDEWYKAAYYDPSASGPVADDYWLYPTRSDTQPTSATPPSTITGAANYLYNDSIANGINGGFAVTQSTSYNSSTNYLSNVGAYSNSASYYGTFDQGGNVWEWNEAVNGSNRGRLGGAWGNAEIHLRATNFIVDNPLDEDTDMGFRLATSVPEPSRAMLLLAGVCAMLLRRRVPRAQA
jgi:formylglycine-generating enzyme required for sulfatase activity